MEKKMLHKFYKEFSASALPCKRRAGYTEQWKNLERQVQGSKKIKKKTYLPWMRRVYFKYGCKVQKKAKLTLEQN
jgi:hypothetical protein